jgi:hypothetical protein
MFIFTKKDIYYVYIDIPIPIGTYVRTQIIKDLYQVIKHWWFIKDEHLDLAHIPYKMRTDYVRQDFDHIYMTFSRDPYQRFISAFLNTTFSEGRTAKEFILEVLANENFDDYHYMYIHFYPQYKFILDEKNEIANDIKKFKLETYNNELIKFTEDIKLPTYDLKEYFDEESLQKFNEIYKKDFEVFGYDMVTSLNGYTKPVEEPQPDTNSKINPLKQFLNMHK